MSVENSKFLMILPFWYISGTMEPKWGSLFFRCTVLKRQLLRRYNGPFREVNRPFTKRSGRGQGYGVSAEKYIKMSWLKTTFRSVAGKKRARNQWRITFWLLRCKLTVRAHKGEVFFCPCLKWNKWGLAVIKPEDNFADALWSINTPSQKLWGQTLLRAAEAWLTVDFNNPHPLGKSFSKPSRMIQ